MGVINLNALIKNSPEKTTIYLSGIGGIGISAIAEILQYYGFVIIGSDQSYNQNIARLEAKGIKVYIGQEGSNITAQKIDYLIRSTAVKDDNPEIVTAKASNLTILSRAEILAEILSLRKSVIVSGSHGKTTTTSLLGHIVYDGKIDPTIISGGIMNEFGSNIVIGRGEWLIAEADESDGSFNKLTSKISVITNIEAEHMDYFRTENNLKQAFLDYINKVPEDGYSIVCYDDPICRELIKQSAKANIITFGFSKEADVVITRHNSANNVSRFSIKSNHAKLHCRESVVYELPLFGEFNILNATACIIAALILKLDEVVIAGSIKSFKGIKRRMTLTGEIQQIRIYDDYAHHPTEIAATLGAVKQSICNSESRLIAVVQPHRYTRVRDHYGDFVTALATADKVLVMDIYSAGETPIAGINKEAICADINKVVDGKCMLVESADELPQNIKKCAVQGDVVICLGAGDITVYANSLPQQLAQIL